MLGNMTLTLVENPAPKPSGIPWRSFAIGFLSGLRMATPLASIANAAGQDRLHLPRPLSLVSATRAHSAFGAFMLFELVGDKLPFTPSRLQPQRLAGRSAGGAFTGACLSSSSKADIVKGAILGATGALAGSYIGYQARTRLTTFLESRDVAFGPLKPALYVALAEDALTVAATDITVSRAVQAQTNLPPQPPA
jgi:uncharacterized membrane protein